MRTTSSREVYRNPWIRVREDDVEREDGSVGIYGVVEREHFALVLPHEHDGFWLIEQFRHPLGRRCWEFPQGTWSLGDTGTPQELAAAELREETGLRAATMRHLGHLDLAPGLVTQEFDVWLATDLTAGDTSREATEADMQQAFVAESDLQAMMREGRLTDGPSLAGYALLLLDRDRGLANG